MSATPIGPIISSEASETSRRARKSVDSSVPQRKVTNVPRPAIEAMSPEGSQSPEKNARFSTVPESRSTRASRAVPPSW